MPIISDVGLFCYDKFEETTNKKVVNMSKLTKLYFNGNCIDLEKQFEWSKMKHYAFSIH